MASNEGHVLLVGSSGGHLAQLLALRPWWSERERSWVTFPTPDAVGALQHEDDVVWAHFPTTRNIPNMLRNFALAWKTMSPRRNKRPSVVVSTGAGVAFPFFVIARMRGVRTAYIEVYDRVESATLTGRLCRRFSSVMLVQWPEQTRLYAESHTIGPLL